MSCVNIFFVADLLGSQYLFEILQTSLTVKNSENVVKGGCFEKLLQCRAPNVFQSWRENQLADGKKWMFIKESAVESAICF